MAPVMLSHFSPKNVAVLGGGDGGALREALNFHSVEAVHLVEIDERVINVSREYLPSLAASMANPKAVLHVADAFQWTKTQSETTAFDIVIVDLLDLTGSVNISMFGHLFEQNLVSGEYDKLEGFVKDIRTIVGDDVPMAFQLGKEHTPTACSLTNPVLRQQVKCTGLRKQIIFLQTLEIASDLQARTIQPYNNFGAEVMISFQSQPNLWTRIDDIVFDDNYEGDSEESEPILSSRKEVEQWHSSGRVVKRVVDAGLGQ